MATTAEPTGSTTKQHITVRCTNCKKWNRIDAAKASKGPKCGNCGTPIALDHPILLDDDSFDRVVNGTDIPVLVDFYADWCGPCKMMAPVLDDFARDRQGDVLVTKLDTDRNPGPRLRHYLRRRGHERRSRR